MTELEYYKDEINGFIKERDCVPVCCAVKYGFEEFLVRHLNDYPNMADKFVDWLLQEHKEPIKLKQWEYAFIELNDSCYGMSGFIVKNIDLFVRLKEKGYFKGITDTSMTIKDILDNCVIVSDDYEGFEECK